MTTPRQKRRTVAVAVEASATQSTPSPNDCPVLRPDYSTTRSVSPRAFLPRVGTPEERERLDPGALWGLRIMEGDMGTAFLLYSPGDYPAKAATIKNSTHVNQVSGEC